MAVSSALTKPCVAVNSPIWEPEATVTAAGTVSAALVLDSDTLAPPGPATFDSRSMQVKVTCDDRLLTKQDSSIPTVKVTKPMLNVLELAL
jgi:hypothetical protein